MAQPARSFALLEPFDGMALSDVDTSKVLWFWTIFAMAWLRSS